MQVSKRRNYVFVASILNHKTNDRSLNAKLCFLEYLCTEVIKKQNAFKIRNSKLDAVLFLSAHSPSGSVCIIFLSVPSGQSKGHRVTVPLPLDPPPYYSLRSCLGNPLRRQERGVLIFSG